MAPGREGGGSTDAQSDITDVKQQIRDLKKLYDNLIASKQVNGTSAQVVGNGTLNVLTPSFSLASIGATGFKLDETGFYIFGKKIGGSTPATKKDVETQVVAATRPLNSAVVVLQDKVRMSAVRIAGFKQALDAEAARMNRLQSSPQNGKSKNASNAAAFRNSQAQIDSLERSVQALARAIGIG